MEKIINVAQHIYTEYKKISGKVIDEMKLHKLLYFSRRESFAVTGQPLFEEEFEGGSTVRYAGKFEAAIQRTGCLEKTYRILRRRVPIS